VIEARRVAYMKFRGYSFVYASFSNGLKELNQATFNNINPCRTSPPFLKDELVRISPRFFPDFPGFLFPYIKCEVPLQVQLPGNDIVKVIQY
jgi:hypothetical protein